MRHLLVFVVLAVVTVLAGPSASAWASGPADGITWTSRASAADNDWLGLTYGNGLFVAVSYTGSGNRVMTSPDGVTWTSRASAADNQWTSVAYGNGLFVAVSYNGSGNRVMTSPDGITWTSRASAADNRWTRVTYGNGLFVAVADTGSGNRVMTSPDGITWTSRASAADNNWYSVTYGNGLFVAVAASGSGNRVMTSPDGITWTSRSSAADNAWYDVTYGNGLFVAVSYTGSGNRVMTSPDGIAWTSRASATDNGWLGVTYGNGLFVAVSYSGSGNRVMTSPDGITWTSRSSAADNTWYAVTYAGGMFVVTSDSGSGNRVMTNGTFDITPPPLVIVSQPAAQTTSTSATIEFSSADPAATFTCSVDGGAYAACTSPHAVTGLTPGAHTMNIRATDAVGNVTTQAVGWTIGAAAPPPTTSEPGPVVELPSNKRCVSRRYFRIHVPAERWPSVAKVTVQMPKTKRTLLRQPWSTIVDLRGQAKGTFTVRITARMTNGKTIKSTRTYRTCQGRQVGSRPKL